MLLRSPVPSVVAVLALALGIGVNVTSFISLNALILHPFPFPRLERIMTVWETPAKLPQERHLVTPANFLDWKEQSQSFSQVAAYRTWDVNLTGVREPVRLEAAEVSPAFFEILGGKPMLGRTFTAREDEAREVVVSSGFWQSEMAGARDAVGKTISLGERTYTVMGVMPEGFDYPLSNQIWTPLRLTAQERSQPGVRSLQVLGLLRPGATVAQSRKEAQTIARVLQSRYPTNDAGVAIGVVPIRDLQDEATGRFLALLMGCGFFVLLLAAANVGNLQLARATGRMRELAVRAALGASRMQVMRQLMAEGVLLAGAGGLCALILASWNLGINKAMIPEEVFAMVPGLRAMHVDATVVGYTVLVSLLTGMLASVPAMVQLLRRGGATDLNGTLQKGGRVSGYSSGLNRTQSYLIGYEVAMALVLLVGAAFMVKAFNGILVGSYGYDPNHVLRMQVSLPAVRYNSEAQVVRYYDRVLDELRGTAGVQSAAVWADGPAAAVFIEGRPAPTPGESMPERVSVSADYLRAMGVPLVKGAFFSGRERPDSARVAVISRVVAKTYWPHSDPVGQRIKLGSANSPWLTVVGVSGDIVRDWLMNEPDPMIYVAYSQYPPRSTTFAVRTAGDPDAVARGIEASVRKVDRSLPIYEVKTMNRALYEETSGVRAAANMMKQYAGVALLLAATGIFGVIAYFVAQRTRDIGVRIALGANTRDVLRMTLRRTMYPTLAGVAIGMAGAYGLMVFMASFLFHIVKLDGLTFAGCAVLLVGTALAASYIPARRAAQVDPLTALREN
jgi:putative ABC transport system permease protein